MSATATKPPAEAALLRDQARTIGYVVKIQLDGLTHEDSLIQPHPGGNCLNWVLGHLVWAYDGTLDALGQKSVMGQGALDRYARGAPPIQEPAQAMAFDDLVAAWDEAAKRVDAGLGNLTAEAMTRPAPFSPSGDASETLGSLLRTVMFHQAYHAGQTAVLRRIAGKEGAIK